MLLAYLLACVFKYNIIYHTIRLIFCCRKDISEGQITSLVVIIKTCSLVAGSNNLTTGSSKKIREKIKGKFVAD